MNQECHHLSGTLVIDARKLAESVFLKCLKAEEQEAHPLVSCKVSS